MAGLRVALVALLFMVGHGWGPWAIGASAEPAHRIGDWTLVDGKRLVTDDGDASLSIACGGGGNDVVIELALTGAAATVYDVRLTPSSAESIVVAGRLTPDGAISFDDAAEDRLLELLAMHGELAIALHARAADADGMSFRFATAGFGDAFPWLGCGVSDTCGVRSCRR
jgi:hypothetical protein